MSLTLFDADGRIHSLDATFDDTLARLFEAHPASIRVIVTDPTVRARYGHRFPRALPIVEIGEGESAKTLATIEAIADVLLDLGVDRDGALLGIGGGLVCDVTAFAAATWMRGIGCGLVPTTLLAQADAGIGGKCAVNFRGRKNLIGAFRAPDFCLCDPLFLTTLPWRERASGLSEIAKMAALFDRDLFELLEAHADALVAADPALTARAVARSLELKAAVVSADPQEHGERRKLNFGHTLGHAIEGSLGLRHGEAVAIGMRLAADLSVECGLLLPDERARLDCLLDGLDLPGRSAIAPLCPEALCQALRADKKRAGGELRFVLLEGLARSAVRVEAIAFDALDAWLQRQWPGFVG
ncbi:MAG: 3-dehydroquinate synthase [Myxococcales bacterium]|nr:3-dehydroquinate synthase [Myxococcales bacterium]